MEVIRAHLPGGLGSAIRDDEGAGGQEAVAFPDLSDPATSTVNVRPAPRGLKPSARFNVTCGLVAPDAVTLLLDTSSVANGVSSRRALPAGTAGPNIPAASFVGAEALVRLGEPNPQDRVLAVTNAQLQVVQIVPASGVRHDPRERVALGVVNRDGGLGRKDVEAAHRLLTDRDERLGQSSR